jgi:iron complex outermembrane receptor protein
LAGLACRTDYDEAEKVSMRGTNPDMTLIIFNGHTVSGGDWYLTDQLSSSRSTSLSLMPSHVLNQKLVESVRDRKGGMFSLQFKPNNDLDMTMTGFHSGMKANNFGRLNAGAMFSMLRGENGPTGAATPTSSDGQRVYAQIRNPLIVNETTPYGDQLRALKSADIMYAPGTTPQYIGETEGAYRDDAGSSSAFLDLDAKYKVNQDLTVKTLFSTTKGVGKTGLDQGLTYTRYGTGVSYALGSLRDAPFVQYYGTGPNVPGRNADGSGYVLSGRAASGVKTTDKESSLQFDAE